MRFNHPTRHIARPASLALALSMAAAAASCSNEEVKPATFLLGTAMTDTNRASFAITVSSPYETQEADQAAMSSGHYPTYLLRIDGRWAVYDDGTPDGAQVQFSPGTAFGSSLWMPDGEHTFEIVDNTGRTVAESDRVVLAPAHVNRILFFSKGGVYSYRFLSVDLDVPAGVQRITLLNAMPTGQLVEFATCTDFESATSQNCTAASDPLAYGELSTRDFPVPDGAGPGLGAGSLAAGLYFRLTPTASLPAPHADAFLYDLAASNPSREATSSVPLVFFTAPRFSYSNGRIATAL